jgi:hypothetical protein
MSSISITLSEALIWVSGVAGNGNTIKDQLTKHLPSFKPLSPATVSLILQTLTLLVSSKS